MAQYLSDLKKLLSVHRSIRNKRPGCATEVARRLGMSRSAFFRHLTTLRELGAEPQYNPGKQRYEYAEAFDLLGQFEKF